jgi:hypothetical protein
LSFGPGELPNMPLRKPDDDAMGEALKAIQEALEAHPASTHAFYDVAPPEAFHYESELNVETIEKIQQKADETLQKEEWVVIDGVDKR